VRARAKRARVFSFKKDFFLFKREKLRAQSDGVYFRYRVVSGGIGPQLSLSGSFLQQSWASPEWAVFGSAQGSLGLSWACLARVFISLGLC
jgi:hypothetical protein